MKSEGPVRSQTKKASLLARGSPGPGHESGEAGGCHQEGANVKATLVLRPAPWPTVPRVLLLGLRLLAHENTFPGVKCKTQEFSIFSLANNDHQERRT